MHHSKLWAGIAVFVSATLLLASNPSSALAAEEEIVPDGIRAEDTPDIQWFRQELRIDPKYTEQSGGILGMSWAHFLTMTFLVLFFFGALIAYHRRTTRTTRILEQLLKED